MASERCMSAHHQYILYFYIYIYILSPTIGRKKKEYPVYLPFADSK